MKARAVFTAKEEPTDAIPFVLTPTERAFAAWGSVHLEKMRRELNARDAAQQTGEEA